MNLIALVIHTLKAKADGVSFRPVTPNEKVPTNSDSLDNMSQTTDKHFVHPIPQRTNHVAHAEKENAKPVPQFQPKAPKAGTVILMKRPKNFQPFQQMPLPSKSRVAK